MFVRNVYLGWEIEREGYKLNVLMGTVAFKL